ncbi:hypothetical protein A6770_13995 [Nostoc minutum NIES-26]|uniref:Uncharacterized protein n=1 Tax=Nostoc minutum NIES-26 TaxID=1844469 RepID=A0A367RPF4_9NOSO|nr:hypothetical protein A6770_13995 [Nostoc minutum NIES-26]
MFLKRFSGVVATIILSCGSTAIAQTTNNNLYIQVGSDSNGEPIILDLASIKGTEYIILQKHDDGMAQTNLRASCGQHRLVSTRLSIYNSTGKLTRDDKTKREISLKLGTPEANSMEIVCRGSEVRGGKRR